jgi:DNA-binding MarR family transcriptional regulator
MLAGRQVLEHVVTIPDDDVNRLRTAIGRISRTLERQSGGAGMTRTELSVLGAVARAKSLAMSALADLEGNNPTMLSRVVGRLEASGLVVRVPAPTDRRAVIVEITPEGARVHARLRKQRTRLLTEWLADLSAAEVQALVGALPALETLAAHNRRPAARVAR